MTTQDDAVFRMGWALYRESKVNGVNFYSLHDLINQHLDNSPQTDGGKSQFKRSHVDFWGQQEEVAKRLAGAGIAEHHTRAVEGDRFLKDQLLRLTPFGSRLYELAQAQVQEDAEEIEGLVVGDVRATLADEVHARRLADGLRGLPQKIDALRLSNFDKAAARSYVDVLIVVCEMPDPDAKLFWLALNRLSQIAGVASLIVALIALKAG